MVHSDPRPFEGILEAKRQDDALYLRTGDGRLRLKPVNAQILRVTYTQRDDFVTERKPGIVTDAPFADWNYTENEQEIRLNTAALTAVVRKETGSISYYDADGKQLLKERPVRSRNCESFPGYRSVQDGNATVELIDTPSRVKHVYHNITKVFDKTLYHFKLNLEWQEKECLYGLGQQEEGNLNLRGKTVYLHQANLKIPIPVLVSSLGYGILMDTYAPSVFNDNEFGSYFYLEADLELDYYFMNGRGLDGVVHAYRTLTGKAPMLPKWAFGFVQCQERYEDADQLTGVIEECRRRRIGVDCVVLDWMYWEDGCWGEKRFDPKRFPDPKQMIDTLHENHTHFMISMWPIIDESTKDYKQFEEEGLLLPFENIYDSLNPKARALYWKQVKEQLFDYGVDAFWCDNSEPFTPEWNHLEKPEPFRMLEEFYENASNSMPMEKTNTYPFYHSCTIYEGMRSVTDQKRVTNLTRACYTGQQRNGVILWSGDTYASWATLKRQIPAGLSFCVSGLPYWTVDAGGFFVKPGTPWYWCGEYEKGYEDPAYRELYTRWVELAAFLPIFRTHGTDTRREFWHYGEEGSLFYDALLKTNRLRYRLLPYIYSQAGKVWKEDATIMRMLAFDFPEDPKALEIKDQYLFGDSLMVCPVTDPMYYGKDGAILNVPKTRKVYLPAGCGWYDFETSEYYEGGQEITVEAPIDRIPVFVKAGSILPMGEALEYVDQKPEKPLTLRVYRGKDTVYTYYEDSGDGYDYEKGAYALTTFVWNEKEEKLTVSSENRPEVLSYELQIIGR